MMVTFSCVRSASVLVRIAAGPGQRASGWSAGNRGDGHTATPAGLW